MSAVSFVIFPFWLRVPPAAVLDAGAMQAAPSLRFAGIAAPIADSTARVRPVAPVRAALSGILSLFGLVIAYFGLLWLGRRFFAGRYPAELASGAVVIAFAIGVNWPYWPRPQSSAREAPSVSRPVPAAAPLANPLGADVGGACREARLTSAAGRGHLDAALIRAGGTSLPVRPETRLQNGEMLVAEGWAANAALDGPAASVCAVLDGEILARVNVLYGATRLDVASAYKRDALSPTGFAIVIPADRLTPGKHEIQAAALTAEGSARVLSGSVRVVRSTPSTAHK